MFYNNFFSFLAYVEPKLFCFCARKFSCAAPIRSTSKKAKTKGDTVQPVPVPIPQVTAPILPQYIEEPQPYPGPAYDPRLDGVNIIPDNELIANVFCFGTFTGKISSVVYNDLTGNFPFM